MGAELSKERQLYDCVRSGDIQSIRALHREGASLNWMSSSGKTPLILACSAPHRLHVLKALLDLGADVNYYDPQSSVGTAIQNAAERRLEEAVILLLSLGDDGFFLVDRLSPANPRLRDMYGRDALDSALEGGRPSIILAIQSTVRPPQAPSSSATASSAPSTSQEEEEIAMAIAASIQSAVDEGIPLSSVNFGDQDETKGCENGRSPPAYSLSAPIAEDRGSAAREETNGLSSLCVICTEVPVEAACIPCGHLVACMACLTKVKMTKFGCPVCRARIERIMKIYTV